VAPCFAHSVCVCMFCGCLIILVGSMMMWA